MTINHRPSNNERFAIWKGTMQVQLTGPNGELFPVHIPIVDLPQDMIDELPVEDQYRGLDIRLMQGAVVLCLN